MDQESHIVSGIYTTRTEAEAVRRQLLERGVPGEQMSIVDQVPTSGTGPMVADDGALKGMLVDGAIGAAVGTGLGALGEVALVAANVSLFIASPLIAPLAMLGWGASLGALVGAAIGNETPTETKDGKFSELVLDAIRSGHVVLIVHTRSSDQATTVRGVVGDSIG